MHAIFEIYYRSIKIVQKKVAVKVITKSSIRRALFFTKIILFFKEDNISTYLADQEAYLFSHIYQQLLL